MIETVTTTPRLPIIGGYGGLVSTSECRGSRHQTTFEGVAEGLPTARQTPLPRRRRMVDRVYSQHACGLLVRDTVQTTGRYRVLEQVWGSTRVSGTRDTTSDDSFARGLGKAAQLQVGRIRHDGQHSKRQQSNFVWLQTLCSRGAVLVCPSIVLEEEVVVAHQRSGTAPRDAKDLFAALVSAKPETTNRQESETQEQRSETVERVQGCTEMQSLRVSAPCSYRLSSRSQRRQEVRQQTCHSKKQFEGCDPRSRREVHPPLLKLPSHTALARTQKP